MIKTARQVKDLTRNLSQGDSFKAQVFIRNYMLERLLERISLSEYRDNFILKGGLLISSMVGNDIRKTMDMDTTIRNMELSISNIKEVFTKISSINLGDNVIFEISDIDYIMDELEYGGLRLHIKTILDNMVTPLKIDISTGDVITPNSIEYNYKLMFEDRKISICAYNIETVLAEKMESIISKSTANTRLRDFYDLYILQELYSDKIDISIFKEALMATSKKRNSIESIKNGNNILSSVANSEEMKLLWKKYQDKFDYARNLSWDKIMDTVSDLYEKQDKLPTKNQIVKKSKIINQPKGPKL